MIHPLALALQVPSFLRLHLLFSFLFYEGFTSTIMRSEKNAFPPCYGSIFPVFDQRKKNWPRIAIK